MLQFHIWNSVMENFNCAEHNPYYYQIRQFTVAVTS